jgi:hypothetical protein
MAQNNDVVTYGSVENLGASTRNIAPGHFFYDELTHGDI